MTDQEVMGSVLSVLHEQRHQDFVHFTKIFASMGVPQNVLRSNLSRMRQKGLIEWQDMEVGGLGIGKTTDYGIDVAEEKTHSPLPIVIDQSIHIHNSSHVQIGQGHEQHISVLRDKKS